MTQYKAFKYRIYPTDEQQVYLSKVFGCKRFVYNHYLNENQLRFKNKEKNLTCYDVNKDITLLKQEHEWLSEIDIMALRGASVDLESAFQNFYSSLKGKHKKATKVPRYKSKYSRQSFRTSAPKVDLELNQIKIPKISPIKAKLIAR